MGRVGEFFDGLGSEKRRNPRDVAVAYGRLTYGFEDPYRTSPPYRSDPVTSQRLGVSDMSSVSVSGSPDELAHLAKRTLLVMDEVTLTYQYGATELPQRDDLRPDVIVIGDETTAHGEGHRVGMYCPSPDQLGRWLLDSELLLRAGALSFFPPMILWPDSSIPFDPYIDDTYTFHPTRRHILTEYAMSNRRLIEETGADPFKSRLVIPVVELHMPIVDGVSMATYAQLACDELAALAASRRHLRTTFAALADAPGSLNFRAQLEAIGNEIQDGVDRIGSQLQQVRRSRTFQASGAAVGSMVAAVVAVSGESLAQAVAALGASTGIWAFASVAHNSLIGRMGAREANSAYYFFWLLQKGSERAA